MTIFCSWLCMKLICLVLLNVQVKSQEIIDLSKAIQPYDEFFEKCAGSVTCDKNSIYRSFNGSCNNLEHPQWGASSTPYIRLGPSTYADCDHAIRKQSNGKDLPEPRLLQLCIFLPKSGDMEDIRNFHVNQFGQWIAHDIISTSIDLSGCVDCCSESVRNSEKPPPECETVIKLESNDPVFSSCGRTCMPLIRMTTTTLNFNCPITPQIPLNQASSFVDASQLYGHTADKADTLRTKKDGKLITEKINGKEFMFQEKRNNSFCDGRNDVAVCFDGGDIRHNQHFGLIVYGEIFVRFHNFLVGKLQKINTQWTDEDLYQAARKIMGAVFQISLYRDYLPILLGAEYADKVGLTLKLDVKTVYNPSIIPQTAVEFSGAAYRVPHNLIPSKYYFVDEKYEVKKEMNLNENMMFPVPVTEDSNFKKILRGMSNMPGRCPVASYNFLISNFMFHNLIPLLADLDLLSVDIMRGRDLGVITYVQARQLCGLSSVSSFEDLNNVVADINVIEHLKKFYADVSDIDLIVGSLVEKHADDGIVGETARCIIADGFFRYRYGDRFFCDVVGQPGSFSPEQFQVLWSLDLTKIFCAMSEVDELPSNFFLPKGKSPMLKCESLDINLDPWKCA